MRRITIACAALLLLQACGGGGTSSPTAPSLPAAPPPALAPALPLPPAGSTVLYTATFTTAAREGARGSFVVPGAGTLTASVTWDVDTVTIGAALTGESCNDVGGALAGTCANLGLPDMSAIRPKTFTGTVAGAMTAYVWVGNSGSVSTSGMVRVAFTPAPAATPPPTPRPTPTPAIYTCNGATAPALVNCPNDQGVKPPTARCNDGSYSCSTNRSGTCSSHDGVACWVCPGPLCS